MREIIDPGRLYKIEEVARMLRVAESTLRRMIKEEQVVSMRIHKKLIRIRGSEIIRYLANNKELQLPKVIIGEAEEA